MKKLLLTLVAALGFGFAANAAEVTVNVSSSTLTSTEDSGYTTTQNGITVYFNNPSNESALQSNHMRLYQNKTVTFTAAEGVNMEKIVFNFTSTSYAIKSATASVGTVKVENNTCTWTGSANTVTITNTGSVCRIASFTITTGEGTTTPGGGEGEGEGGDTPGEGDGDDDVAEVTFDFASGNTYGMGPAYDASKGNNSPYVSTFVGTNGPVTITLSSDPADAWRFWTDGLREYYKNKSPKMTLSVLDGNITSITWTVNSGVVIKEDGQSDAITATGWTGSQQEVVLDFSSSTGNAAVKTLTVKYVLNAGALKPAGLSFDETAVTVNGLESTGFEPTLSKDTEATPTYTSSNTTVATVAEDGTVTVLALGTTIITASVEETETYAAGTASYTLNVLPETSPYTVADALTLITNGYEGNAQVAGVITEIKGFYASSGQINYNIADAADESSVLYIYGGTGLNGASFTSEDDIAVGANVVVEGALKNYNGTLEMNYGKLVSYTDAGRVEAPVFSVESGAVVAGTVVYLTTETADATIYYTTDGEEPTDESDVYDAETGITVEAAMTIKAYAVAEGLKDSEVVSATYSIFSEDDVDAMYNFADSDWVTSMGIAIPANAQGTTLTGNSYTVKAITLSFPTETTPSTKARLFAGQNDGALTLRVYANDYMTFKAADKCYIKTITFTGSTVALSVQGGDNVGTFSNKVFSSTSESGVSSVQLNVTSNSTIQTIAIEYDNLSGVEGVEVDANAAVEYFNLQGVRVANPENGLFIRRQGNNVSKVVIK